MQTQDKKPHAGGAVISLLLIVLVGIVMWGLLSTRPNGPLAVANSASPTPILQASSALAPTTSMPVNSPEPTLPQDLAGSTLSPQNKAATKAASVATLSAMLTTSPFPTFPPTPTPYALGIVSDEQTKAQGYMLGLVVQNAWVGVINGTGVVIWAGAPIDAPDEGMILVRWTAHNQAQQQRLVLPGNHGAAKILADQNNRLTLTSPDKATFYYDVPGLSLVSSLTETVPTVDFSAMATPAAPMTALPATPMAPAYP